MQVAVIEFARNVCGLEGANSSEFDRNCLHPVIDLMEEQVGITVKEVPCGWVPGRAK